MTDVGERPLDWERLERLFTELVALPPADRAARLEQLRSGESALAEELASLVACAPLADRFFQELPRTVAAAAGEIVRSDSDSSVSGDAPGFAADDHPGTVVGRYRIGEQLARGGMGVVYRASDTHLHRAVALKFLPPHLWVDHAARERLLIEARAAAALDHPNICTVYEMGETPAGALVLAMPHYEGETLRERLKRGALETHAAVAVATQAARALGAAHACGIVHRDVKPANLMLTANGAVKLLDFGLARLPDVTVTPSGLTPGTTAYMSPEQVRGEPADARADLWALGVVLYEMLTGRRPSTATRRPRFFTPSCATIPRPRRGCGPACRRRSTTSSHGCSAVTARSAAATPRSCSRTSSASVARSARDLTARSDVRQPGCASTGADDAAPPPSWRRRSSSPASAPRSGLPVAYRRPRERHAPPGPARRAPRCRHWRCCRSRTTPATRRRSTSPTG